MFGWIDIPQTAREDRDRPGLDRRLMRPRVDPTREAGDDEMPGAGKAAREPRCEGEPGRRGVAGADDRDFRAPQARKIAAHGDQGRGRGSTPQKRRIIRLANADKTRAQPLRRLDLAFGLSSTVAMRIGRPGLPLAIKAGKAAS